MAYGLKASNCEPLKVVFLNPLRGSLSSTFALDHHASFTNNSKLSHKTP